MHQLHQRVIMSQLIALPEFQVYIKFYFKYDITVSTLKILWPRLGSLLIDPSRLNLCATFYFYKNNHNPSRVGRPVIARLAIRGVLWTHVILNLDFHETYCNWP